MRLKLLCTAILVSLISCSSKSPEKEAVEYKEASPEITTTNPQGPSMTSKMLASEQGTDLVTEIEFQGGSAKLDQAARNKLRNLYQKAQKQGRPKEVQLVTWADKEYPGRDRAQLSGPQKILAEERNGILENYLLSLNQNLKITPVNMAQRTTFLGRVTASDATKIKKSLQSAEIATTDEKQRGPNMTSKSIVLIFLE